MAEPQRCTGGRSVRRPRALSLLLILLLAAGTACRSTGGSRVSLKTGGQEPRVMRAAALRRRADRALVAEERGVRLEVHHRRGELETAREVLTHLREAVNFVASRFGTEIDWLIHAYLIPLAPEEKQPSVELRGEALPLVFFYRERGRSESLLEIRGNAWTICAGVPHELSHAAHYLNGVFLADGWLGEGIPEYVSEQFLEHHCTETFPVPRATQPPLVALERVEIEPWKHYETTPGTPWGRLATWLEKRRERKRRAQDPDLARREELETSWRYAAARPLVGRLLRAARKHGTDEPFEDLLEQIEEREPVGWEESQEIALALTGRRLEELAEVSEEELVRARRRGWERRIDEQPLVRLQALTTLRHLGLPDGVEAGELLAGLDLPAGVDPSGERGAVLLRALTGAVAQADEPELALRAVERLEKDRLELHRVVAPELWGVLAEGGRRQEAVAQLKATLADRGAGLGAQHMAAVVLDNLTGDRAE